ncbi:flagellar filament capping protein FliD [Nitrospina sp. 32_T5]|uniref:flagellar filament capping protein FliD n=1 Tax=unclassified Nitrospina TaxID=2638683 RepID=UPI003F9E7151
MHLSSFLEMKQKLNTAHSAEHLVTLRRKSLRSKEAERTFCERRLDLLKRLGSLVASFQSTLQNLCVTMPTPATPDETIVVGKQGEFISNGPADLGLKVSDSAPAGTYEIDIHQLAQAGIVRSRRALADPDDAFTSRGGVLVFQMGAERTQIEIAKNTSLREVVEAICASSANVTAGAVCDGTLYRLEIGGNLTGAAQGVAACFRENRKSFNLFGLLEKNITQPGRSETKALDFIDSGIGGISRRGETFETVRQAQDASFLMNNTPFSHFTNQVDHALPGATLTLQTPGAGTLKIREITRDVPGKPATGMDEFQVQIRHCIARFNEIRNFIDRHAFDNGKTGEPGLLFSLCSVRNLHKAFCHFLNSELAELQGGSSRLAQIGITVQQDGTLSLDMDKLDEALEYDLQNVLDLISIQGSASNPNVTFLSAGDRMEGGVFELEIQNGSLKIHKVGESESSTAVKTTSSTFEGAARTSAEGLQIRVDPVELVEEGEKGSVVVSSGFAGRLNRLLTAVTDEGDPVQPFQADIDTVHERMGELTRFIDRLSRQLQQFEQRSRSQFANLDKSLSRLESQRLMMENFRFTLTGLFDFHR